MALIHKTYTFDPAQFHNMLREQIVENDQIKRMVNTMALPGQLLLYFSGERPLDDYVRCAGEAANETPLNFPCCHIATTASKLP